MRKINREYVRNFIFRHYSLLKHQNGNRFSFVYSPTSFGGLKTFEFVKRVQSFESWRYFNFLADKFVENFLYYGIDRTERGLTICWKLFLKKLFNEIKIFAKNR